MNEHGSLFHESGLTNIRYATMQELKTGVLEDESDGPHPEEPTDIGEVWVTRLNGVDTLAIRVFAKGCSLKPWLTTNAGWRSWSSFSYARPSLAIERQRLKPLKEWQAPGMNVTEAIEYISDDVILHDHKGNLWKRSGDRFHMYSKDTKNWTLKTFSADHVKQSAPLTVAYYRQLMDLLSKEMENKE